LGAIDHRLVVYKESWPAQRNRPFEPNKPADVGSRKLAADWIVKYLPPTGE